MLHISNLRKIQDGEWTKLITDVSWDGENIPDMPDKMWFAVKNENADMLADDVYDAFFLIPLYMGMYYKHDLYIHGSMSKKLYKNTVNYLERILCDFSDDLSRINIKVDGFKEAEGNQNIIGTGISCGVDSLTTIYDRYINEDDPDYKINALFLLNCGLYGDYGEEADRRWLEKYELNKTAADDLNLPLHLVNSNVQDFFRRCCMNSHGNYLEVVFLAIYSCAMALQRVMKKYYASSALSYEEIITFGYKTYHERDLAGFSESYSVPLIQTERLELVPDGCQYDRIEKTEHIANWDIAQKHLNVCVSPEAENCSKCDKCLRTLSALEAMNKLDDFTKVFDINIYKKHAFKHKCEIVLKKNDEVFLNEIYNYSRARGVKFPSYPVACLRLPKLGIKKLAKKILGKKIYTKIKVLVKGHE